MSTSSPSLLNLDSSSKLNKDESIAALIMLGWELKLPNLLINPKTFNLNRSIGIIEDKYFIFVDNTYPEIYPGDKIVFNLDGEVLQFKPSTMLQIVWDNTNG